MDFISSMFGGGVKMGIALDAKEVPVGGILAGTATMTGTSKAYPITSVKLRLLYVHVESQEGGLPKIDTRILVDNTLVVNEQVGVNEKKSWSFTVQIPPGTEPTAHNTSYKVMVVADIPGVKDPSATADLKVKEGEEGAPGLTLDAIYARWPALRGTAERPLLDALRDLRYSHSNYDDTQNLGGAEPVVASLLRHESADVRREALDTWSTIIGDNPTKANVQTLATILRQAGEDEDLLAECIDAAKKFHAVGGLDLVKPYGTHSSDRIRERLAIVLWGLGNQSGQALMILQGMVDDAAPHVRAKVIESLGNFDGNKVVLQDLVNRAGAETNGQVLEAYPRALRWGFYSGSEKVLWPLFQALARSEFPRVRKNVADSLNSAASAGVDLRDTVLALLADVDPEVRHTMAYELQNFPDEARASYVEVARGIAENDPSDYVRRAAINAMARMVDLPTCISWYRQLIAAAPREEILRGVVHGVKFNTAPEAKVLLKELSTCNFGQVADEARYGFEYSDS
jgi:HEAT repeat protein